MSLYAEFIHQGGLVFDIGANIGNRTQMYLDYGARRVVAVEPQPDLASFLLKRFKDAPVIVVAGAVGETAGEFSLHICHAATTLTSMAPEWIEAVQASGRFREHRWDEIITVPTLTLDGMIDLYGRPDFVKIDVEDYELKVLRGLRQSVPALSFEFTPEILAPECFTHLVGLGMAQFNYSLGESLVLEQGEWADALTTLERLRHFQTPIFGDVYARRPHGDIQ